MAYWLLKTEPDSYSWDDQVKKGAKGDAWTGVRNFRARAHLTAMKKGDLAFFYHTGDEKQLVGIVEVIREAYPDPTDKDAVFKAVDIKAVKPLKQPVTLAAVKADKRLKDMVLARQPRLSVQPGTAEEWKIGCGLGGLCLVMPRESGASSKHRPLFYLMILCLLDRPLSRAMTITSNFATHPQSHQQILARPERYRRRWCSRPSDG